MGRPLLELLLMRVTLQSLEALSCLAARRAGRLTDEELANRLEQGVPKLRALVEAYSAEVGASK